MFKVSACVITKNEAENLPSWLRSMSNLADEMIVVDTGSTDDTVKIARNAGAKVYTFDWCDDFSAAKNYALSKAAGEWILFLDADEYIPESDYQAVRDLLASRHRDNNIIGFMCRLINIDVDDNNRYIDAVYQIRIFRNLPELRYVRPIHETLKFHGKKEVQMQYVTDFIIYHTGYSAHVLEKKLQRNLKLLLEKKKTGDYIEADDYYLADTYYSLREYEKAIKYVRRAIKNNVMLVGNGIRMYLILIQAMILQNYSDDEINKAIQEGEKKYPKAAELPFLAGQNAWQKKDYINADIKFRQALEMYALACKRRENGFMEMDALQALLPQIYCTLGRMAAMKKDSVEAVNCYKKALEYNLYHQEALQRLLRIVKDIDDVTLIQWLNQRYDKKSDAEFLLKVLPPDRGNLHLYYINSGNIKTADTLKYLWSGNLKAASAALTEEMDSHYRMAILQAEQQRENNGVLAVLLPNAYRNAILQPQQPLEFRIHRKLQHMRADLQEE